MPKKNPLREEKRRLRWKARLAQARREEVRPLLPDVRQRLLAEARSARWAEFEAPGADGPRWQVAWSDRLYPVWIVALDTGARLGELLALEVRDWNPEKHTLRFSKTYDQKTKLVKRHKRKAARRTVRVGQETAAAVDAHIARMRASGDLGKLLFGDPRNGGYCDPEIARENLSHLCSYGQVCRFPWQVTFAKLRHTHAALLLLAGVPPKKIAARLGIGSPKQILRTYGHLLKEADQGASTEARPSR
jgi:integrase